MSTPRTLEARQIAAQPVTSSVRQVKASINTSLVQIGELISNIGRARLDPQAHMPISVGMMATEHAAKAASALTEAYRFSVEAHRHLAADKDMLGIKVSAWGDGSNTFGLLDEKRLAVASPEHAPEQDGGLRIVA